VIAGDNSMGHAAVTIFICVTCRSKNDDAERPGRRLFDALAARLGSGGDVTVTPVECLAVCKRPCTIAVAAAGKWSYVVGDLDPESDADDVVTMALHYGTSADGIVPWRERPHSFRRGIVSRIPPLASRGVSG
jgi:predicted metal-binding protein